MKKSFRGIPSTVVDEISSFIKEAKVSWIFDNKGTSCIYIKSTGFESFQEYDTVSLIITITDQKDLYISGHVEVNPKANEMYEFDSEFVAQGTELYSILWPKTETARKEIRKRYSKLSDRYI